MIILVTLQKENRRRNVSTMTCSVVSLVLNRLHGIQILMVQLDWRGYLGPSPVRR